MSCCVFGRQAGTKACAVLVDDLETGDADIADITDPAHAKMVGEYDLNADFQQIIPPELGSGSSFFHDVVVKLIDGRYEMLLSYWDGGYVKLDVTVPRTTDGTIYTRRRSRKSPACSASRDRLGLRVLA
jgi:hypothetical protein